MNLLDAIEFHPSSQMLELQAEQGELIREIYRLMYECEKDPLDSFKRHDLDKARADYKQIVADLQLLHPLGSHCPAHYCDQDLYSFYSDMHKAAYGFRYRGDMSVAGILASMPYLQETIIESEAESRDEMQEFTDRCVKEEAENQEELALIRSYDTGFDHHDPRITRRIASNQQQFVLQLRA